MCNVLVGGKTCHVRVRRGGGRLVGAFVSLCACTSVIGGAARAERDPSGARAADGVALLSGTTGSLSTVPLALYCSLCANPTNYLTAERERFGGWRG